MEETQDGGTLAHVTHAQAEQALLRAVIDCAEGGDTEQAREAAEALVLLSQAQLAAWQRTEAEVEAWRRQQTEGPAGGAAGPMGEEGLADLAGAAVRQRLGLTASDSRFPESSTRAEAGG